MKPKRQWIKMNRSADIALSCRSCWTLIDWLILILAAMHLCAHLHRALALDLAPMCYYVLTVRSRHMTTTSGDNSSLQVLGLAHVFQAKLPHFPAKVRHALLFHIQPSKKLGKLLQQRALLWPLEVGAGMPVFCKSY